MVAGAGLGCFAVQLLARPVDPHALSNLVATYVVFVALPLLVGRYLAQHQRLVSALDRHNRQLRRERELLAERERLRERLLIARNMHDSLGHRLSLVSIQAAALEVSELPPRQRQAVRQLATAARGAMDELHELVGALRQQDETGGRSPGVAAISEVVEEFRAAGMPVTLLHRGEPQPLPTAVGQAAYRVVEEGLTNAAKHAPGQRVTVCAEWEPDALLLTVVNDLPDCPTAPCDAPAATGDAPAVRRGIGVGHGLTGLSERVRLAGGFLDRKPSDGEFRLVAMLPAVVEEAAADDLPAVGRIRTVVLGFATAALMFVVLPAGMLLGAG
jgi:signal transduction histidine kinase